MRGKVFDLPPQTFQDRITPAYAGKSNTFFIFWCTQEDHPRLCGEKFCKAKKIMQRVGSPPPMRGKAVTDFVPAVVAGITPAYAGKSLLLPAW